MSSSEDRTVPRNWLYRSSRVKGEKEDNRKSVVTLVNLIAESGEFLKLDTVFPDQKDRVEKVTTDIF